jgi:aspartate racemase
MEQDFYRGRLEKEFGIRVHLPDPASRDLVHRVIYEELCRGVIAEPSRAAFREVVSQLASTGSQAVILGCTEISLLLRAGDVSVPLFDTTLLHAQAAASFALDEGTDA